MSLPCVTLLVYSFSLLWANIIPLYVVANSLQDMSELAFTVLNGPSPLGQE